MAAGYWSELPLDLLVLIFSRLEVVDFMSAAAACRSWRQPKLRWKDFPVRPKNQSPWLMLSTPSSFRTQSRCFHSLLPSSDTHEIRLPKTAGQFCIGSSQGFLISIDEATTDLCAVNPISGAHTSLPPTSTIDCDYALGIQYFWLQFGKVIFSPDPGPRTAAVLYSRNLLFSQPGDGKWTHLSRVLCFHDMLFHKNRLHAVSFYGELAVFDLGDPSLPHSLLCEGLPNGHWHTKCYLVESPDGHDLYYVTRSISYDEYVCFLKTTDFCVYKLDTLEGRWIEVDDLGDLALFLGFNHSLALSSTEHLSIRRNSIYFTDDYKELCFNHEEFIMDMGVFDVGDGSIQLLSHNLQCLNWPPPIWFTPTL